jgi:hypothetical protein
LVYCTFFRRIDVWVHNGDVTWEKWSEENWIKHLTDMNRNLERVYPSIDLIRIFLVYSLLSEANKIIVNDKALCRDIFLLPTCGSKHILISKYSWLLFFADQVKNQGQADYMLNLICISLIYYKYMLIMSWLTFSKFWFKLDLKSSKKTT